MLKSTDDEKPPRCAAEDEVKFYFDKVKVRFGWTGLHEASRYGHDTTLSSLLEQGCDVNAKVYCGWIPLHRACKRDFEEIVSRSLEKGAAIKVNDVGRQVSLKFASNLEHEAVDALLRNENTRDNVGLTPLHLASSFGHETVVKCLLERSADVDAKDNDGLTPLHRACQSGHLGIATLLLEWGADINTKQIYGDTHSSDLDSDDGSKAVSPLLPEQGARINGSYNHGRTPTYLKITNGEEDAVKVLLERDAGVAGNDNTTKPTLHWAGFDGHETFGRIELFLECNADIDASRNYDWTPLHWASWKGHEDVVRLLLERGALVNAKDDDGKTPIHMACVNGHGAVVKLLLECGAHVDTPGCDHRTAPHWASQSGNAKFLLEKEAVVDANDSKVWALRLILDKAAEMEAYFIAGATPFPVACAKGLEAAVRILLKNGAEIVASQNETSALKGVTDAAKSEWSIKEDKIEATIRNDEKWLDQECVSQNKVYGIRSQQSGNGLFHVHCDEVGGSGNKRQRIHMSATDRDKQRFLDDRKPSSVEFNMGERGHHNRPSQESGCFDIASDNPITISPPQPNVEVANNLAFLLKKCRLAIEQDRKALPKAGSKKRKDMEENIELISRYVRNAIDAAKRRAGSLTVLDEADLTRLMDRLQIKKNEITQACRPSINPEITGNEVGDIPPSFEQQDGKPFVHSLGPRSPKYRPPAISSQDAGPVPAYVEETKECQDTLIATSSYGDLIVLRSSDLAPNATQRYQGEYLVGLRHGRGTYSWTDGSSYDGDFRYDKRHGSGTYTWPDGSRYEGEFVNGKREGFGLYVACDGGKYEGSWKNGQFHGFGAWTRNDGRCYVGEWRNGVCALKSGARTERK